MTIDKVKGLLEICWYVFLIIVLVYLIINIVFLIIDRLKARYQTQRIIDEILDNIELEEIELEKNKKDSVEK